MGKRAKPKVEPNPGPADPRIIETYRAMGAYELGQLEQREPSAWNGEIRIRRYRITVELIDEPIEVLRERLRRLWRTEERNHHRVDPMRAMAKRLGMDPEELEHEDQGIDHKAGIRG